MADESPAKRARVENLGTLTYFPLMAKGLGPALCAELSGLAWKSNKNTGFGMSSWADLKGKGKAPFGQLPILETGGLVIGQATAICNYIGHAAGKDGKDANEYAMSQMLVAEGEDLYALMVKFQPTIMKKDKSEDDVLVKFWVEDIPPHTKNLEKLIKSTSGDGFTSSGTTTGEIYLFAVLHQMVLVSHDVLNDSPALNKWYDNTKALSGVQKVLKGNSNFGEMKQYFIAKE